MSRGHTRPSSVPALKKRLKDVVYYANAWCDEYSAERPYKTKDFASLAAAAEENARLKNTEYFKAFVKRVQQAEGERDSAHKEVERLREAVRLLYGAHAELRMDTKEDEVLRHKVLALAQTLVPWLNGEAGTAQQ